MRPIPFKEQNEVLAKDQPQYIPLPAYVGDDANGEVITCWELSMRERIKLLFTGKLWISKLTFGQLLQPLLPSVDKDRFHALRKQDPRSKTIV